MPPDALPDALLAFLTVGLLVVIAGGLYLYYRAFTP